MMEELPGGYIAATGVPKSSEDHARLCLDSQAVKPLFSRTQGAGK